MDILHSLDMFCSFGILVEMSYPRVLSYPFQVLLVKVLELELRIAIAQCSPVIVLVGR
ncbi:hypothetical protein GQ55_1G086000 [Panicum hallii var. hallii]|uniref:Uncharacterized protein n=1 Tax=Panicum hallii var. hallii TaxID=1504633 RepID=A0A2T7F3P9_9POAL|nr:hypothetical protein GQ55_1G086000 [Panicum hallii var. hallii]